MCLDNLRLSRRAERIAKAEIRNMTVECERVGGINLAQGVCDMPVPGQVIEGARRAMDDGLNAYTRHDGIDLLRQAIAKKMAEYNRIDANPETDIVVSGGSTGALYCACLALLDPGDEVILFEPYYGYHLNTLLSVDVIPKFVPMEPPDWTFSLAEMERVVSSRTRAILVNTPGNPTGKVFTDSELQQIADFALEHDLFIFTDEIYEYFVYGESKHLSIGSITEVADRTITISGYSKTFSITGWRIGYSVSSSKWAEMIGYVNDLIYVCAPAPLQAGVAEGIKTLEDGYYHELRCSFTRKLEMITGALRKGGFKFTVPQGAYYILADASHLPGVNSKGRAMYLLNRTGVAAVPGEAFYQSPNGKSLLRFCYAKEDSVLAEACQRFKTFSV